MENFFEREVKRLAFVEERMKIREQEKKQLDAEESKRQQVSDKPMYKTTLNRKRHLNDVLLRYKNTKEIIIDQKEARMVKSVGD